MFLMQNETVAKYHYKETFLYFTRLWCWCWEIACFILLIFLWWRDNKILHLFIYSLSIFTHCFFNLWFIRQFQSKCFSLWLSIRKANLELINKYLIFVLFVYFLFLLWISVWRHRLIESILLGIWFSHMWHCEYSLLLCRQMLFISIYGLIELIWEFHARKTLTRLTCRWFFF